MNYYRKKSRKGFVSLLLFLLLLSAAVNFYYLWPRSKTDLILINNRENYGVYCVGEIKADSCYWFDGRGVIWGEAKTILGESILKTEEVSDFRPARGIGLLPKRLVPNFIKVIDFLKTGYLEVDKVILKRGDQELEVSAFYKSTGLKTKILFNLRIDPQSNLVGLVAFLKKNRPKELEYIDLRVENKIFYK